MNTFLENVADIIIAASKSPLGIFSLMIITLAFLAYIFFRKAPLPVKVTIFFCMFIGVVCYGVAITRNMPITPDEKIESVTKDRQVEKQGFLFSLNECKKFNNTITCFLQIRNIEEQTRNLSIIINRAHSETILIVEGLSHNPSQGTFGNFRGQEEVREKLRQNIDTSAVITFKNIATEAEQIELLELQCIIADVPVTISFRDIPLSR